MSLSTKTLNTRISLRYDTWSAWSNATVADKGANLILKRGEIAFCEVPSGATVDGVENPPHILYKVGDGTKKFSELAWGSAKASDVYTWAKESQTQFESRVSKLISAALNGEEQVTIKGYVTKTDFNEFKTNIDKRFTAIEEDYTRSDDLATAVNTAKDELIGHDDDAATAVTIYGAKNAAAAAAQQVTDISTRINQINVAINELPNTYATNEALNAAETTLKGQINAKVAQQDYDAKVSALEQADKDLADKAENLTTELSKLTTTVSTLQALDQLIIDCGSSTTNIF